MNSTIYLLLFFAAVGVVIAAALSSKPPTRACLNCGRPTRVQARRCSHCGYNSARPV